MRLSRGFPAFKLASSITRCATNEASTSLPSLNPIAAFPSTIICEGLSPMKAREMTCFLADTVLQAFSRLFEMAVQRP
jgi:hypothetical protein